MVWADNVWLMSDDLDILRVGEGDPAVGRGAEAWVALWICTYGKEDKKDLMRGELGCGWVSFCGMF